MHYADTSALAKLVVPESESTALRAWIADEGVALAASDLARTELIRAVRRAQTDTDAAARARDVLSRIMLLPATAEVFEAAALLEPSELRSLDAVHLTSALVLGDALESVVTYDDRLADAARALGLRVTAPV